MILLFTILANAQSRDEILFEIDQFSLQTVGNKEYDINFEQLWDVVYSVGSSEYNTVKRESKQKGYIDFYQEDELYKEWLTIEILGKEEPYRISYQLQKESRKKNLDGTYTGWINSGGMPSYYLHKLQFKVWISLYGKIDYPKQLLEKIETYNKTQKKDRKKIIFGRDYK